MASNLQGQVATATTRPPPQQVPCSPYTARNTSSPSSPPWVLPAAALLKSGSFSAWLWVKTKGEERVKQRNPRSWSCPFLWLLASWALPGSLSPGSRECWFWGQRHGPCWQCLPAVPCAGWASGGLGRREGEVFFWLKKLWCRIRWHITQWDLTCNSVPWESPERILYARHLSKYLRYSSKQNRDPCPHGAYKRCTYWICKLHSALESNKCYERKGHQEYRDLEACCNFK